MYVLVLYIKRQPDQLIGKPKTYNEAFRKYEKLTSQYPDRRYALRRV